MHLRDCGAPEVWVCLSASGMEGRPFLAVALAQLGCLACLPRPEGMPVDGRPGLVALLMLLVASTPATSFMTSTGWMSHSVMGMGPLFAGL